MIAMTDASRSTNDATPFRCVTGKSLISKADDAKTQMTQDSGPALRCRSRKEKATPRRSGHWMTATARQRLRPQGCCRTVACGRSNSLIQKAATASDRTDRKDPGSFYLVGRRGMLAASQGVPGYPPEAPSFP